MTTLATLRTQCRNLLGDTDPTAYTFADDILTDYINRAIADLNAHFPRRTTYTITCSAGDHDYSLLSTHQQILSVEYPGGQDPPQYLQRLAYTDSAFWGSNDYYDFIPTNDAASLNPPRLVISPEPAAGETIIIELTTEHSSLTATSDVTTIPDRFLHLVALFVRWKTWENLASQEGMDPNPLKTMISTHGLNATRAEASYRAALAAAKAAFNESAAARWAFPDHDRIY